MNNEHLEEGIAQLKLDRNTVLHSYSHGSLTHACRYMYVGADAIGLEDKIRLDRSWDFKSRDGDRVAMGLSFPFFFFLDSYTFLFLICRELESDVLVSFLAKDMPSEILYACPVITCKLLSGLEARDGCCSPRLGPEPQSP
jgi:hypothetical protein